MQTKRKNEASWDGKRWSIKVQLNGTRKSFYSSIEGKKGKIDCEKKADDWLVNSLNGENLKVEKLFNDFIEDMKQLDKSYKQFESIGRSRIIPSIGKKKISTVTEQDLQNIIHKANRVTSVAVSLRSSSTVANGSVQRLSLPT